MTDTSPGIAHESGAVNALRPDDPPALGLVRLHGRLHGDDAGSVLVGRVNGRPVVVAWMGAGAETDAYARARFTDAAEALADHHRGLVVAAEDDPALSPWVALDATDDRALTQAQSLLDQVVLTDTVARQGATPDFRPHWWKRSGLGRWRVWPLPWPRVMRGYPGWTYLVSALIMAVLVALGLWIAALVLDDPPPDEQPPQPFPTTTPSSTPSPPTSTPTQPSSPTSKTTRPTTPTSTTRKPTRTRTTLPPQV